jgi:uncharacterized protein (TIGR02996 family)
LKSASNPELERAILWKPDDTDRWLVYGDWLQGQGDPRGELIAVQHALSQSRRRALITRERALLDTHAHAWLGALAIQERRSRFIGRWHLGFLRDVVMYDAFHVHLRACSSARFLRSIRLDLRDSKHTPEAGFERVAFPLLEHLSVETKTLWRPSLQAFIDARLPSLDLWIGEDSDATIEDVTPLLAIDELGLRGTRFTNQIVAELARSRSRLRVLDLRCGHLDDDGARTILANLPAFQRLERLHLEHNRMSAFATELTAALGSRVTVAPQMEAVGAVFDEHRQPGWDSDDTPSPYYNPYGVAPEPFLGREGGRLASDALAVERSFAFWRVDRGRAEALGVHRNADVRKEIATALRGEPATYGEHLARLLDDPDPNVTKLALEELAALTRDHPFAVPVERIRGLLEHDDRSIRDAAASRLVELHLPADAERIIGAIATGSAMPRPFFADWAGAHPASDQLFSVELSLNAIARIVRRRRVAGLSTDFAALRSRVLAALTAPMTKRDDHGRAQAVGHAANIIEDLHAAEVARELALAVGPADDVNRFDGRGPFDDILRALRSLGEAGVRAVAEALPMTRDQREQRLGWLRDALAKDATYAPAKLETADAYWLDGRLEDFLLPDSSAFGAYALVLNADPTCAFAAFQAAWIERGFGTPITAERVAWLSSLGVARELLDDLAAIPESIVPGHTFRHHRATTEDPALAEDALAAGLPSVAARYLPVAEAEAASYAAREHLERVRRNTPKP